MTKTIREQLQEIVEELRLRLLDAEIADRRCVFEIPDLLRLKAILATPEPEVRVKPGWVCKDKSGMWWSDEKPEFYNNQLWHTNGSPALLYVDTITDPWPDHPNGGPECLLEVK